ncbi:MAG TPA: hypothetical protein IAC02_05605 [Candidatus Coprovivens excrementavium]|nr:hypothetical protein [Candidatus Coprovivens excrementavium]
MFIGILIAFIITVLIVSIVVGSWKDEQLAVSVALIAFLIITLFIIFRALFII